jgi:hypothetical protein
MEKVTELTSWFGSFKAHGEEEQSFLDKVLLLLLFISVRFQGISLTRVHVWSIIR